MLSLPEDTVTRVQRKRASKADKGSGEEGKMTKLMRGLELIIELKTIQAVTLLVSMSTQSWQFCQPPRVLFSPVCCKQDKTQKWGGGGRGGGGKRENPTGRVSQMLCSRYSICSLHILAQWPSFSSPPVEIKQRAQWQVETERREHWSISEWFESPGSVLSTRVNEKTTVWVVRRPEGWDVRCVLRFAACGSRHRKEALTETCTATRPGHVWTRCAG